MKKLAITSLLLVASMILGSSGWAQSEDSQQGIAPAIQEN